MNNIRLGRRTRSRHLSRRSIAALILSGGCMGAVGVTFSTDALEVYGPGDESTTTETTDPDDTSTTDPDETSTTDADDTSTTDSDDTSTSTDPDDTSTSTDASTTSAPGGTQPTTAPATGTSAPAGSFEELLATQCADQEGQPLLAEELEELRGTDGSRRIVQILEACDVVFEVDVVVELGRPSTNVEAMIDDPANDVTPNQAQIDALNSELGLYWRIAQDVLAQADLAGPTTTPTVATIAPAEPADTGPTTSNDSNTTSSTSP